MADLHEVVDFRAAAYVRLADRRPINRALRLNFDVVFDYRDSRLAHLVPVPVRLAREAEAVAADDDSIL